LSDELHGIVLPVMDLEPQKDAVTVAGVHKWYRVYASPTDRLRRVFGRPSRHLDFQALDDVSFSVTPGSALGVIGENGAGKTTLLKLIAGTTKPTAGRVEVRGIVAAILELGAAFHPEFSGRDNAILYGALMGLDRAQMERRLDDILAFAELGEFIDHPVKSYSTGMAMRLGFAVATHVDPDVLVVDEALAVGDGYFQKKCVDRIRQIRDRGTTILFCSHSMYYVTMFCERALWLAQGRVERIGPAHEVVEAYESFLQNRDKRRVEAGDRSLERSQSAKVGRVAAIHLPGRQGDGPIVLEPGGPLEVEIEVESSRLDERYHVGVALDTLDGRCVLGVSTTWDGCQPLVGHERYRVRLSVPALPVAGGTFHLSAFLLDDSGLHVHDQAVATNAVRVESPSWTPSLLVVPHRWEWR
jgi:ABC-type polysaccharide/polyol phosphate transport system ATPase subunit